MSDTIVADSYRVRVLGPLTVSTGEGDADLGGPKQRLLFALLLSDVDHVVSSDRLIEGLWGEEPPPTARKAVQVHVSNLRRSLGDAFPLRTAPGGYIIQSADVELDAADFEAALDSAKAKLRTDPLSAERMMSDALSLWSGSAYADLDGKDALAALISDQLSTTRHDRDQVSQDAYTGSGARFTRPPSKNETPSIRRSVTR